MQYLWHHVLKKSDVPLNHYMNLRAREAHNCKRKVRILQVVFLSGMVETPHLQAKVVQFSVACFQII